MFKRDLVERLVRMTIYVLEWKREYKNDEERLISIVYKLLLHEE